MTGKANDGPTTDTQYAHGPPLTAPSTPRQAEPLSYAAAVGASTGAEGVSDVTSTSNGSSASSGATKMTEPSDASTILSSARTPAGSSSTPCPSLAHGERQPASSPVHERSRSSSRPRQDDGQSQAGSGQPHRPAPVPPAAAAAHSRVFANGEEGDGDVPLPLNKYTLFETRSWFYILASSQSTPLTRVLKIDRSPPPPTTGPDAPTPELNVVEDQAVYNERQAGELLRMIEEGNRGTGGLEKVMVFYGIVGFVRFTAGWYMILITKRSVVALIGGHYVYHCDETILMSVSKGGYERSAEETRQLNTFQKLDLSKNFYFSYTYDLTSTLQSNLTGTRLPAGSTAADGGDATRFHKIAHRYMWNYALMKPAFNLESQVPEAGGSWKPPLGGEGGGRGAWILPIIHGFVDQAKLAIVGRTVYITLIGRRSRFFAGARYLKRGANQFGHVANEVETEQIVSEPSTSPFHAPLPRYSKGGAQATWPNPNYTSYVQYRGSIPLLWTQTPGGSQFRPPIEINVVDPFFSAAARHFDSLLRNYGGPIIVLNLIKAKEAVPREMKLLAEFTQCIGYLNQFLPEGKKLIYIPWDMSRATKSKDQDVVGILDDIAEESIQLTGFFHSGRMKREDGTIPFRNTLQLQRGICRTNCVDCLDRTNAAQFAMGKRALGHQLYALGILPSPLMDFESVATDLMTGMFQDHGDTLALQYSGGALVNRWDTYQRSPHWNSHSRDLIENIKRYYANSLLDAEKQASIDQFLNIVEEQRALALESAREPKRGYRDWFALEHLEDVVSLVEAQRRINLTVAQACDHWTEYYRPRLFTSFDRHFAMRILGSKTGANLDVSPFKSRQPKAPAVRRVGSLRSVRRWMSTDLNAEGDSSIAELLEQTTPAARVKKATVKQQAVDGPTAEEDRREQAEFDNLARIISRNLEPKLDAQEIEEYVRWAGSHEDELFSSDTLGRPVDLSLYETTVRTLGETSTAEAYTSSHADVKAYRAYSALDARELLESDPMANSGTGANADARKATIGRAFQGGKGWAFPTTGGGSRPSRPLGGIGEGTMRKRTLHDRARG